MRSWTGPVIGLLVLCVALPAADAVSRSVPTPPARSDGAAAADTARVKKERVRKETPPAQPVRQTDGQSVSSESEGGFWDQCFSDCLGDIIGSLIGSICSGVFGGGDEEVEIAAGMAGEDAVPQAPGVETLEEPEAPIEGFPYAGVIEPKGGVGATVWLWDRPGAYIASGVTVEPIPAGAEVTVTSYEIYADMVWLQVSRTAPDAPLGWVRRDEVRGNAALAQGEIAAEDQPEPGAAPAPIPLAGAGGEDEEGVPARETGAAASPGPPRWELGADLSLPVFSQTAIEEEYKDSYRIGLETSLFLPHSLKMSLGARYLHADGVPLYDYVSGAAADSPRESDLDIVSVGVVFGQSIFFAGGSGFFSYGLGPALFMVQESAFVDMFEEDDWMGTRTDKLREWKGGGEAALTIGGVVRGRMPLSFQVRFALIPWKAAEEKSLTLDFLGTEVVSFFTFGVGIGFYSF